MHSYPNCIIIKERMDSLDLFNLFRGIVWPKRKHPINTLFKHRHPFLMSGKMFIDIHISYDLDKNLTWPFFPYLHSGRLIKMLTLPSDFSEFEVNQSCSLGLWRWSYLFWWGITVIFKVKYDLLIHEFWLRQILIRVKIV